MTTTAIQNLLASNTTTRKIYIGCFPSDKLPNFKTLIFPAAFVCNLDKSNEKGSHWCSVMCKSQNEVWYFDSLSLDYPPESILNFLNNFTRKVWNKTILQSLDSNVCGHYCVFFIYSCALGKSFEQILFDLSKCDNSDVYVKYFVDSFKK